MWLRWKSAAAAALSLLLAAVAAAKAPPASRPVSPATPGPASPYIEAEVDSDTGQFTFGVPGGPILLYGHPLPWSSFTSVRVDGADYTNKGNSFGTLIQAPLTVGDTNEGIWQVGSTPIQVHQILTLVTGPSTGHPDTFLIRYRLENTDTSAHVVGLRIMLDTDLNDNDGAPFRVPGTGSVTTEKEWVGPRVPSGFFVFNDLNTPSVTAEATLRGGLAVPPPGKLQLAAWPDVYGTAFDYTVTDGKTVTNDSCYNVFWENYTLAPGQAVTFSTYYGLGGLLVDTAPPLASSISAPVALECLSNILNPNPFDLSLYLSNSAPGVTVSVTGISAQLVLPAGMVLLSGSATQTVADLAPGADALLSWTVAVDGSHTGPLGYTIQLHSSNAGNKTLSGTLQVPSGCTACYLNLSASADKTSGVKPLAVAFTATGTPTNCSGTVTYDWDFGDGSAHASGASATHTYTVAGTYVWSVTATMGSVAVSKSGTLVVSNVPPPVVTSMRKVSPPFKFVVAGSNFQNGIRVFIDGVEWPSVVWKNSAKVVINGAGLKTAVPKGQTKAFRFLNPDGGETTFTWNW